MGMNGNQRSGLLTLIGFVLFALTFANATEDSSAERKRMLTYVPMAFDEMTPYENFYFGTFDDRPKRDDGVMPGMLRFGKRDSEMPGMLRFGKRSEQQEKKAVPGVLRFGKRSTDDIPGILRFGKRQPEMPGLMRFGKRSSDMPGLIRFGKRNPDDLPGVLRFGRK
ncbi:hypothetical protein M3Y98_01151200 [Aphelenchoides besseyi]|nr:hypothetical protein M3Y98_01151200 [Aphelenchoides besseyi]KAI6210789.1 hypothetical protein M3Y96_00365500 [Aphelenchoides besseyi]